MMQIKQTGEGGGPMHYPQPVVVPARYDGIGSALRSAFLPRASDMPDDLGRLLDRLR